MYYSESFDTPENKRFLEGLATAAGPDVLPSTFTLGAYDGMALIYKVVGEMQGDRLDGDAVMASLAGYSWTSPRGKVTIDAETREPIQDFVIRRVEDTDRGLRNVVIATIPQVVPAPVGQ
ncbi:MAG: ABC transporter substrate-binding protein [Paracoccaceae bacterium]